MAEDEIGRGDRGLGAGGVIRRYKAVVDRRPAAEIGRVIAFVDVTVAPERGSGFDDVAERIARFREIRAVHLVSGRRTCGVEVEGPRCRRSPTSSPSGSRASSG